MVEMEEIMQMFEKSEVLKVKMRNQSQKKAFNDTRVPINFKFSKISDYLHHIFFILYLLNCVFANFLFV